MLILIVVGIMVSGILPLYVAVIRSNKSSSYYSSAYRQIDSQLETYRRASFDGIANGTFAVTDIPGAQGTVTVSNVLDGAPQTDIKQVNLKIRWHFKKDNQINASSYITRNGVGRWKKEASLWLNLLFR